jgi:protein farnesyltransferase subunit beta
MLNYYIASSDNHLSTAFHPFSPFCNFTMSSPSPPHTTSTTTEKDTGSRVQFLLETETTESQQDTEDECQPYLVNLHTLPHHQLQHVRDIGLVQEFDVCLLQQAHVSYLSSALLLGAPLKPSFVSLDASRPWIMYWCLHALDVMNQLPLANHVLLLATVETLKACWCSSSSSSGGGGFGGGPGQMAHGAPTYAAIMVLSIIATCQEEQEEESAAAAVAALELLRDIRKPLYDWCLSLKLPHGGFSIHANGEWDVRATYTIVSVAKLLNVLTPELQEGVVEFIKNCQTYEGGFGGEPASAEAHGGYTYCAVAALELLGALGECNLPALRTWLCQRQTSFEGGFNGRCNKLVDGCYSFWQGAALAIVSQYFGKKELLCNVKMLQRYILLCAQDLNGGLRDKPSKPRDFYHSCYNLSGLSISQHYGSLEYGHATKSKVAKTDPCYNIRVERVEAIQRHFSSSMVIEEANDQE